MCGSTAGWTGPSGKHVKIVDSFCDMPKLAADSTSHADGFESDGGGSYVFRHNTIRNPNKQTSAILLSTNDGGIRDVVIDRNLLSGGGYTVYCGTTDGGVASDVTYTNNIISREFFPKGGCGAGHGLRRCARGARQPVEAVISRPGGGSRPRRCR